LLCKVHDVNRSGNRSEKLYLTVHLFHFVEETGQGKVIMQPNQAVFEGDFLSVWSRKPIEPPHKETNTAQYKEWYCTASAYVMRRFV
jgi:hypothetical protein